MVRVITDSSADLPSSLTEELGITVVPLYVRFGDEVYREHVTISDDEFYEKLSIGKVAPVTVQAGPQDFTEVYDRLSSDADGLVSIHLSSKLSGTYNSAIQAKDMVSARCPIEVIDSQIVSVGLGLVVIAAAKAAEAGENLQQVVTLVKNVIPKTYIFGLLDTSEYLRRGGRIGRIQALVGSALDLKLLVTLRDGEVASAGRVRSRLKGIERLVNIVQGAANIEDIAIGYSTTPDEAQGLSAKLAPFVGKDEVKLFRLGTTLGVHTGPGGLAIGFRGEIANMI